MTGIFLSRICLKDFRTFGNFDIAIPAAPGLTILTGTNGLGKSNFFDAVEWGLTGKVRRFSLIAEKKKLSERGYLTRIGAVPDSHHVKLVFSDGTHVERGTARTTTMKEIIALLADTDVSTIKDLDTYLALTHFLGQSSEQRFTSRDSQEQWRALRGPSGIDRLESVREGIKRRAITFAFTRRKEDEEHIISGIDQKIAEWDGWQTRLERLRQAMHAAGELTAHEIVERINTVESELATILKQTMPVIEGEASAQRLARVGGLLTQALESISGRVATVVGLSDLIDQFTIAASNSEMDHPQLLQARQGLEKALVTAAELSAKGKTASTNVESQNSAIRSLEQNIVVLEAVRADLSRQQDIGAQILAAEAEESRFAQQITIRRRGGPTAPQRR
jgi:DNA repair exonuclease SbcCD ATPase subunit